MLFSGIPFLYYFLPAVILVYFLVPRALKNTVLLLFSLAFYAWGEPIYVFLMLATVAVNYILGILIEKFRLTPLSRVFVIV
ncbi:MAG: MBOAT family protein, partial [Ruminococcaceae bacterium]|nr:MBOAT family protein [Oscillospiraceae bacterium]